MKNKHRILSLVMVATIGLSGCGGSQTAFSSVESEGDEVIVDGIDIDQVIADTSNIGLGDLKESQISIFKDTAKKYIEEVKSGTSTVDAIDDKQDSLIDALVIENVLPINGVSLFNEWKHTNGYYDQFTQSEPAPEVSKPAPEKPAETPKPAEVTKPAPQPTPPAPEPPKPAPPVQTNKPQPSPEQKVEQANPKPSENLPPPLTEDDINAALEGTGSDKGGGVDFDNGLFDGDKAYSADEDDGIPAV